MAEDYGGLRGAYRHAFAASSSWVFRSYVAVSALLGTFVAILLALGTVTWVANPTGRIGGRALPLVIGLFVLVPLTAPVLVAARRYRTEAPATGERPLAVAGYLFVLSWYVALVVTDPDDHDVGGVLGPLIDFLDSLPRLWGLAFPAAGTLLVVLAVLLTRPNGSAE